MLRLQINQTITHLYSTLLLYLHKYRVMLSLKPPHTLLRESTLYAWAVTKCEVAFNHAVSWKTCLARKSCTTGLKAPN